MTSVDRPQEADRGAGEELPFFVYGTLRPGEVNHDLFLRGRTRAEEPARLPDARLYDGPGYPYAVQCPGARTAGELIVPAPGQYARLLAELDRLEDFHGPGSPLNLYERVRRTTLRPDGSGTAAWVYLAAPRLAATLTATGTPIPGGDWRNRPGPTGRAAYGS
ncbi:gamma-glutamylcyclotransferase family protein [Streptomyces sp. G-G2]|uniref:gamma-glutamylcyclotransferase family protein n=1 Tax=Streptomyces sp. G-G2 TaxID=3046201 RepID=UPI0024BB8BF2|nr:gamma-glutamylcyclotransferase family protein [Streptomyces sp. G-G2]MDJ0383870.1 gamma-glutamylcyclotransferase family protein [Streptomyces sp. G-G2]